MSEGVPLNAAAALIRAREYATGERSWLNLFMQTEADVTDRTQTLAHCAIADAQEVVKWGALAQAYAAIEQQMGIVPSGPLWTTTGTAGASPVDPTAGKGAQ